MTAEIIGFPKKRGEKNRLPETENGAKQAIAEYRMQLINDMLNTRFSKTMKDFAEFGFPMEDREFIKNVVFTNEMLRSILWRAANIYHPLVDGVDEMREKYEKGLTTLQEIDRMFEDDDVTDDDNEE
jgi:hypothetical protein